MDNGKITLSDESGEELDFYLIEQTELSGNTYLLVTDEPEDVEEAECLILREIITENDEAIYETVEDDVTLTALLGLFKELLEDVDITL
ncbi:MAG: DUF1292 domain-containing protein [Eubacterium sp.]|nr:DUF1292 domain-containing protein [Eubacterium sp.]